MMQHGRLRQRANWVLASAAVLYAIVFLVNLRYQATWLDAVYWVVQSALIGSVADWFAVTALFRKPLGFPYHTALIPRNRDRMINGLVTLVETKLLTIEQCRSALSKVRFLPILDRFIQSDTGRNYLRNSIRFLLIRAWETRTEAQWAAWGAVKLRAFMHRRSIMGPLQQLVTDICTTDKHEKLVVKGMVALQEAIDKPQVLQWLTTTIDEEIEARKQTLLAAILIGVSEAIDIINARDMAMAVLRELYMVLERWKQPNSLERRQWLLQWLEPLQAMAYDKETCKTIDEAWQRWIDEQDWETVLETYVCSYLRNVVYATVDDHESPATLVETSLQKLWAAYRDDETVSHKAEELCHHMAEYVLINSHSLLGTVVRQVLNALSTEKFIAFIESKVDDDLSWIRINGALVGSACGLGVWGFLTFCYEPFLNFIGLTHL